MDVADWLRRLGLEQYAPTFAENHIGAELLRELTTDDLKDLGVASVGHRRRLLAAIASLRTGDAAATEINRVADQEQRAGAPAPAERRQVSVMFCDLVGSTALSATLDPEDLRELIGRYHACVAQTVGRFDGFVAKYMGDGVLAYFGYPHAHEDDAEQAMRAGLALIDAVGELSAPQPLQARIGIATGLVVVGDLIGQGSSQEQAIVGETPNLAARLQALAEPGAIVIAESMRRQVGALFDLADLGPQVLKGFAALQRAWRVVSENRALGRFEALRSQATPLVGREEELELLLRRLAQAKSGSGRVVLVSAEPGIGKSRLAEALAERIAAEPHIRLRYFCSPHHQDSALYPVIAQMERAAGFARADAPEAKLEKLQALLHSTPTDSDASARSITRHSGESRNPASSPTSYGSTDPAPAFAGVRRGDESLPQSLSPRPEDLALIAELHSLPTDFAPKLDVTPQKKKEMTFAALLRQVERLAQSQPVLMVFEDIHWIDPSSRELLDRTIKRVAEWPVLLLATFRPEFVPSWSGQPHVTMLNLARLDRNDTAAMVANIAGNAALPSDIVQEIAERADGVPLFVEELTKAVLESGTQVPAALAAAPHAALSVPATLHASLMARLDRLGATAKDVAQKGAVIGREFGYELLTAIADLPNPQLAEALDKLTDSGLLLALGTPPQSSYVFKHALVQDAAYSTLLRSRRRQLHGKIAALLESQFPESANAHPEILAHHFTEAGLIERATECLLRAAAQAARRSGMSEAEALLRRGLSLASTLPNQRSRKERELDLQIALGRVSLATRGFGAASVGEAFGRARALCEELDRTDRLLPILYGQYAYNLVRDDLQRARQLAAEMWDFGERYDHDGARQLGRRLSGTAQIFLGEFAAASVDLEGALAHYRPSHRAALAELTLSDPLVVLLVNLAWAIVCCGRLDQGRKRTDAALAEARRLGDAVTLAYALQFAFVAGWSARSEPARLVQFADELLALADARGFAAWRTLGLAFRGWSLAASAQASEGVALLLAGLAEAPATTRSALPLFLVMLADAHRLATDQQSALERVVEAEQCANATGQRYALAEALRLRGDLLIQTGDHAGAEAGYRESLALAQRQGGKLFELRAATSLARLWRDQGRRAEASGLLAQRYGWFTEGFDAPDLIEAKALLDELS